MRDYCVLATKDDSGDVVVYNLGPEVEIETVNSDDYDFYNHLYLISVSPHTNWDFAVFADNLQDALDYVMDHIVEKEYKGLYFETMPDDEKYPDEFLSAGNYGYYFSEMSCYIAERQLW